MKIERSEFKSRREAFAAAIGMAGHDGALVVSRGGSTLDRYGNVLYLTGHYQHYSYLPESPPTFSGRAHNAFALTADGAGTLCVAVPEIDEEAVVADRIAHSDRWAETVRDCLRALGLADGRVLLVGADVLPTSQWEVLREMLPRVRWSFGDGLIEELRRIKSPAEQAVIRESAAINRKAVTAFFEAAVPGATEADAVAAAAAVITGHGAGLYYAAVSSGPRTWAWMSAPLPGWSLRRIEKGDLVRLDLACVWQGYLSDFGRTVVAGGQPSSDQTRLLDTLHADIVAAGDAALAQAGVALGGEAAREGQIVASYPVHWGHCLGLGWERPWMTPPGEAAIEPGMVLAIERALTLEGVGTAAAEQNLLVTQTGFELLTEGSQGRWS